MDLQRFLSRFCKEKKIEEREKYVQENEVAGRGGMGEERKINKRFDFNYYVIALHYYRTA